MRLLWQATHLFVLTLLVGSAQPLLLHPSDSSSSRASIDTRLSSSSSASCAFTPTSLLRPPLCLPRGKPACPTPSKPAQSTVEYCACEHTLRPKTGLRQPTELERTTLACASAKAQEDTAGEGEQQGAALNVEEEIIRIKALIEEGGSEGKKIADVLTRIEKGKVEKKADAILKGLRKRSGATSVGVELELESSVSASDLELLSVAARKGRSSIVSLDLSSLPASLSSPGQALRALVAEQESARGEFPGPCPVAARIPGRVSTLQVAEAVAAGARGVVAAAGAHDAEELRELCGATAAAGACLIAEVESGAEAEAASAAGAKALCVRGAAVDSVEAAIAVHGHIPKSTVALAAIPSQQPGGQEVEDYRALLLGAAYDGVLLMAAAELGDDDGYVTYILDTLQSKKSSQYSFGAMGTSGEVDAPDSRYMPAAQEAKKKNPRAWAKAQREAKSIVSDYRRGKRSLKTD